jgi:hypothetical protein
MQLSEERIIDSAAVVYEHVIGIQLSAEGIEVESYNLRDRYLFTSKLLLAAVYACCCVLN